MNVTIIGAGNMGRGIGHRLAAGLLHYYCSAHFKEIVSGLSSPFTNLLEEVFSETQPSGSCGMGKAEGAGYSRSPARAA